MTDHHHHDHHHDEQALGSPGRPPTSTLIQPLRLTLIVVYIPAFALCIAHGAISHRVVPALGLLPLTVSATTAVIAYFLREKIADLDEERRQRAQDAREDHEGTAGEDRRLLGGGDDDTGGRTPCGWLAAILTHTVTVFILDVILAAACMVVLVFTWIEPGRRGTIGMLAAYATIPLFTAFFVHVILAFRGLARGLALKGLLQWTAWRALPADCPHCNVRLRPSSLPELPWLKFFQKSRSGRPDRRGYVHAPVVVDERDRYRDEVASTGGGDGDGDGGINTPAEEEAGVDAPQPDAIDVPKKDRKGKGPDGSSPWST